MLDSINLNTPEGLLAFIIVILWLIGLIVYFVLLAIKEIKTKYLRDEFIKTLDEHDKAVIMTYKATSFKFMKEKADKK